MINIIHHEERANGKVIRDYYVIRKDTLVYNSIDLSQNELIELREKLNALDKK
jgi:hypothetical protein